MKYKRALLGVSAIAVTAITSFVLPRSKLAFGTLATFSNGRYHNVPCISSGIGNGNLCPFGTYYTRVNHTNTGLRLALQVYE